MPVAVRQDREPTMTTTETELLAPTLPELLGTR